MFSKGVKKLLLFVFLLIGGIGFQLNAEAKEGTGNHELYEGWVIVEQPFVTQRNSQGNAYELLPYRQRRADWNNVVGFSSSQFEPYNYQSNFSASDFSTIFESATTPLVELNLVYKKNYQSFSLGMELGVGTYSSQSLDETLDLTLMPAWVGARVALDGFTETPWFAPYFSVGTYIMGYNESQANSTVEGNTQVAFYYRFGALIGLNWIDPKTSRTAYEDSEIENTFLNIEARQFWASSEASDPNFESDLHLNAGLLIEFR